MGKSHRCYPLKARLLLLYFSFQDISTLEKGKDKSGTERRKKKAGEETKSAVTKSSQRKKEEERRSRTVVSSSGRISTQLDFFFARGGNKRICVTSYEE